MATIKLFLRDQTYFFPVTPQYQQNYFVLEKIKVDFRISEHRVISQ